MTNNRRYTSDTKLFSNIGMKMGEFMFDGLARKYGWTKFGFKVWFSLAVTAVFCSCVHHHREEPYGIQPGHEAFVAAKIAVFPCQMWPNGARLSVIPLSKVGAEVETNICKELDQKVIEGFSNQPHMVGKTPRAVLKMLKKADKSELAGTIFDSWNHRASDCNECESIAEFYNQSIADREEWRRWLSELTKATRYSDAILIPFLVYAADTKFNDRGLFIAERSAQVAIVLIATDTGELIWAGSRKARIRNLAFEGKSDSEKLEYPDWESLYPRLFTKQLWQEFPGRQER